MLIASGYRHSLFWCRNRIESVHSVNQFMLISAYICRLYDVVVFDMADFLEAYQSAESAIVNFADMSS